MSRRFWPTPTAPGSHQVGKMAEWGGSGNPLRNGESIASVAVSPASQSPLPGSDEVRQMIDGCGPSSNESLAYFDRNLCWWRTYQASFPWMADSSSTVSCPTWPRSGMTLNGIAYRLPTLAHRISGIGSGSWPTPAARDWRSPNSMAHLAKARGHHDQLPNSVKMREKGMAPKMWPTPRSMDGSKGTRTAEGAAKEVLRNKGPDLGSVVGGGQLNPTWVEWLMGYPSGWTDLEDSGTQ